MKPRDLAEWQGWCSSIAADTDPAAEEFVTLVTTWADTAEKVMATQDGPVSPLEALRITLPPIEEDNGIIGAIFIGQALVVLGTHWDAGLSPEEFYAQFTSIEAALYREAVMLKMAQLHRQAEQNGQDPRREPIDQ